MIKEILDRFISSHGVTYSIYRENTLWSSLKGLPNTHNGRRIIQFLYTDKIRIGDCLVNPVNEKVLAYDVETIFENGSPVETRVFYKSEVEYANDPNLQLSIIKELIETHESSNKEQLMELHKCLSSISNSNKPFERGALSKFSKTMEDNSWITSAIASFLLSLLLKK